MSKPPRDDSTCPPNQITSPRPKYDLGAARSQAAYYKGEYQMAHQRAADALREADRLRDALNDILEWEREFKANMPPDWIGDPLSDACDRARKVLANGSSWLPMSELPEGITGDILLWNPCDGVICIWGMHEGPADRIQAAYPHHTHWMLAPAGPPA